MNGQETLRAIIDAIAKSIAGEWQRKLDNNWDSASILRYWNECAENDHSSRNLTPEQIFEATIKAFVP